MSRQKNYYLAYHMMFPYEQCSGSGILDTEEKQRENV
jgi:hypothetical protein